MKTFATLAIVSLAASLQATTVDQVIVRQQWPWSTDIKVEYKLSDVKDGPVDFTVKAFNGETALNLPVTALKGKIHGIDTVIGSFAIDPVAAFGDQKVAFEDFKVQIIPTASPANINEVIYKIFDLETNTRIDVTRADLLDNKYGAYTTDYGTIGSGFTTTLDDVLIWTDAVNYPGAKTTKLIMRKVNAAGKTFTFGSTAAEYRHQANETNVTVQLTEDFFIGIFEFTQKQFAMLGIDTTQKDICADSWKAFQPAGDALPYNNQNNANVRGGPGSKTWEWKTETINWPNNPNYPHTWSDTTHCGKLRMRFNYVEFDLPTEAQWEFACRGGSTTSMPSGKNVETGSTGTPDSRINEYAQECGWIAWYKIAEADKTIHEVGLKKPNAYGLYDMIGNVSEQCLDYNSGKGPVSWASDAVVTDPTGPTEDLYPITYPSWEGKGKRVFRGPNYRTSYQVSHIAFRLDTEYQGMGTGGYLQFQPYIGFRLVIPATENGKWASSPEKTH